ncbi:hypothetical protein GIB67_035321 [Kingdonia uniflora]|uniref:Methyltransferase small domain-containing protein n=1 Tax=Kingdonia uniflora TaxID=39325 RepID=A0A7J7KY06_9MAGN|nr:hypothetical protein GIB67_035321 [Kingdonia uniflora]
MGHSIEVDSANPFLCSMKKVSPSRTPFRSAQIRLVSGHPEVYEPCDDSFALVDALLADRANLLDHKPVFFMEVGCGSGYVITSLAIMLGQENAGRYYFATDTNPHAARVTRETLEAHGVHAEVISDNIASAVERRLGGMVDVIVVNPPYVPTPEDEVGRDGIASAWAGGENGRTVIDRILPVTEKLLSDKARTCCNQLCLFVPSDAALSSNIDIGIETDEERLMSEFKGFIQFLEVEVVATCEEQLLMLLIDTRGNSQRTRKLPDEFCEGMALLHSGLQVMGAGIAQWQKQQYDTMKLQTFSTHLIVLKT